MQGFEYWLPGRGGRSWAGGGASGEWVGLTRGHQETDPQSEGGAQQRSCLRETASRVAHQQVDQQLGGQLHSPEQQLRLVHVQPQPRYVQAQAVIGEIHSKPEGGRDATQGPSLSPSTPVLSF